MISLKSLQLDSGLKIYCPLIDFINLTVSVSKNLGMLYPMLTKKTGKTYLPTLKKSTFVAF